MNVNGKYIKDESGSIISPISSAQTVYDKKGNTMEKHLAIPFCQHALLGTISGKSNVMDINCSSLLDGSSDHTWYTKNGESADFVIEKDGLYYVEYCAFFYIGNGATTYRCFHNLKITNNTRSIRAGYSDCVTEHVRGDDKYELKTESPNRISIIRPFVKGTCITPQAYVESGNVKIRGIYNTNGEYHSEIIGAEGASYTYIVIVKLPGYLTSR